MNQIVKWHDDALAAIETKLTNILEVSSPCQTLLDSMRYSTLAGGKRIRPLFTIAAGNISNASNGVTTTIGATIELIHCFSLIHDDLPIMDNDDLRRGKPTNHIVYGDAVALLAGDALHALCFEILSHEDLDLEPHKKLKIISLIASAIGIHGMVGGQTIDWLNTGKKISLEQLQEMHLLKTGALLQAAIMSGYLAGNQNTPKEYEAMLLISHKIGLLFQIIDDVIDHTEDTATLGKTAGKDQEQNKATYVTLLGLKEAQKHATNLHHEIVSLTNNIQHASALKYLADMVYYRNN